MTGEVNHRIAQASKIFGELCNSVFKAHDLSIETKRHVYQSVVLGTLLYSTEIWAPTEVLVKKLEIFSLLLYYMHYGYWTCCIVGRAYQHCSIG